MKTYEQALQLTARMFGEKAWHNLMDGLMNPWTDINMDDAADILSLVYDTDRDYTKTEIHEASVMWYDRSVENYQQQQEL